jgi:hypothetical protein
MITLVRLAVGDLMFGLQSVAMVNFAAFFPFRSTLCLFFLIKLFSEVAPSPFDLSTLDFFLLGLRLPPPVVFDLHCFLVMDLGRFREVAFGGPLGLGDKSEVFDVVERGLLAMVSGSSV